MKYLDLLETFYPPLFYIDALLNCSRCVPCGFLKSLPCRCVCVCVCVCVCIVRFVEELFLAELVISRDTNVWQKDLCQSRNSREPLNVWSVIDGFGAGEALLYTSVQLLRGRLEASSLEDHATFMVVERRRRCVCVCVSPLLRP